MLIQRMYLHPNMYLLILSHVERDIILHKHLHPNMYLLIQGIRGFTLLN